MLRPVSQTYSSLRGPRPFVPLVTYALIAGCVLVFLVGPVSGLDPLYGGGNARACTELAYYHHWGVIPSELMDNQPLPAVTTPGCPAPDGGFPKIPALSVLTAMFVHGGWLHLLGNMLFLYVFGAMVEERMGRLPYLLSYVALGYLATYGYALFAGAGSATQTLVGASGAIAGILGAYLRLHPRARVTSLLPFLLFLPLRFPAWLVLGVWFAIQWASVGVPSAAVTGVAYTAHLIGFAGGFLFAWLLYRRGRGYADPTNVAVLPGDPP
jgi:membrane associated rhomboid family serine protease